MNLIKKFNELDKSDKAGIILCFSLMFLSTFAVGIFNANDEKSDICIIRKPIEIVTTFPLFLGCQLGQDKFEIKLN